MFETLDKIMLAGLGALSMTRERAEKIFDDYVNRGKEKTRSELEKIVSEQVRTTVSKLSLATHEDLDRVEKKLDELLSRE